MAQGRGQGRAVVNTGVNFPGPQKAVSKGLRKLWEGVVGVGEVACNCTAVLNSLHFLSCKGKFFVFLKNFNVLFLFLLLFLL